MTPISSQVFYTDRYINTSEGFLLDYNTEASKKDFIAYMEAKISERYRKGKGHREGISETTRKNHTSTLNCPKKIPAEHPLLQHHS